MHALPSGHHRIFCTGAYTPFRLFWCFYFACALAWRPIAPAPPHRTLLQPPETLSMTSMSIFLHQPLAGWPSHGPFTPTSLSCEWNATLSPPPHAHITAWTRGMSTPCPISLPPSPSPSTYYGTHSTGHCPNAWYPHWLPWPQGPQHGAITRILPPCLFTLFSACTSSAWPPHTLTPDPRGCG